MTTLEWNMLHVFDRLVRPEKYSGEQHEDARHIAMGWSSSVVWLRAIELYNYQRTLEPGNEQ
jgi:hypothetical protein